MKRKGKKDKEKVKQRNNGRKNKGKGEGGGILRTFRKPEGKKPKMGQPKQRIKRSRGYVLGH